MHITLFSLRSDTAAFLFFTIRLRHHDQSEEGQRFRLERRECHWAGSKKALHERHTVAVQHKREGVVGDRADVVQHNQKSRTRSQ